MKLRLSQLITFLHIKQEIWELAFEDISVSLPLPPVAGPGTEGRRQVAGGSLASVQHLGQGHLCHPGLFPTGPTAPGLGTPERAGEVKQAWEPPRA